MRRVPSLLVALCMGGAARAEMPDGEYLPGRDGAAAVILAHGRGQGPDGPVVGALRRSVHRELGFHTLSLQMPVLSSGDFRDYASTFPDAFRRIQGAIDFLTSEKGVKRIYLMGYSMGARMTTAFLAERPAPAVVGYVGVGLLEGGGKPLDANENLRGLRLPVLDLFAERTPLDLQSADRRRSMVSDAFRQVRIADADHGFRGHEDEVAREVVAWLREREGGAPR